MRFLRGLVVAGTVLGVVLAVRSLLRPPAAPASFDTWPAVPRKAADAA